MRLRHEIVSLETRSLVTEVGNGMLRLAGPAGGPAWDIDRRAALFADLERGWPTWPMLAWNPGATPLRPSYLLDGHRRVATLMGVFADEADLVRDLTHAAPTYLRAEQSVADGAYWPINALVMMMPFLRRERAVRKSLPAHLLDRAAEVGSRLACAPLRLLTVFGGDVASVALICERLLPARVSVATLEQVTAGLAGLDIPGPSAR